MKISTKGRYALRLMVDLASHAGEGFIPLKELAARQQISLKYAESIVALLVKGELLLAERGAGGGYQLAQPADGISVASVLRLAEGSLHSVACLEEDAPACPRVEECKTVGLWRKLDSLVADFFEGVTVSDLV